MEHLECVIEFKNGERDSIDPVWHEDIRVENDTLIVEGFTYTYEYPLKDIDKWCIRPYSEETTYDPIKE